MQLTKVALKAGTASSAMLIALAAEGAAPDWVQLLPFGEIVARDGRRWTLPKAKAAAVIAASLAIASGADLPFDYDHQSDYAAVAGVGGTAPASGWIKELQARADGIWARVEWTGRAAELLAAKEYRYASPVFNHTKAGEVTAIRRAALTNTPALDLAAVASEHNPGEDMDFVKIAAALGLAASATEDEILAAIAAMAAPTVALTAELAKVRTALKLPETADGTAICTAIATATAIADAGPNETVLALAAEVTAMKAQINSDAAAARLDAAVAAGRIPPAARADFLALASSDPARFDSMVGNLPVVVTPGPGGKGAVDPSTLTLTADQVALCSRMGWDQATYLATLKEETSIGAL